jgi:large subunit ribosomal protein L9
MKLLLPFGIVVARKALAIRRATFVPPITSVTTAFTKEALPCQVQYWACRVLPLTPSRHRRVRTAVRLAKKKTAPAPVKKIQVKMLKYVEGTGHIGEIVMVTPAFFQNKLRPTVSAIMISDEEVEKERAELEAVEKIARDKAEALKERLADLSISLNRKAGPDGHLFGGIGPKLIIEELGKNLDDDFLKSKSVKIVSITDAKGVELGGDIKHTGTYQVSLSLTKGIAAPFDIVVGAEN